MSSLLERLKRVRILRAFVYAIVGAVSYPGLVWDNRLKISGTENIKNLPPRTVLFVSNIKLISPKSSLSSTFFAR